MLERKLYKTVLNKKGAIRTDYFMIKNDSSKAEGESPLYGVEIRQVPLNTFSLFPYLKASAPDICDNKEAILTLLDEISEGEVDPSTLFDIVEDRFESGCF